MSATGRAGMMAHYGKFSGVENYIALVRKKGAALDEKERYYGEKLVLNTKMNLGIVKYHFEVATGYKAE